MPMRDRTLATTATAGTGAITPGAAVPGFRNWAGAAPGTYSYFIEDGQSWETGRGAWNGTTLTRAMLASSSGSLLSLSGSAVVGIDMLAADYPGDWPMLVVSGDNAYGGGNTSVGFQQIGGSFTKVQMNVPPMFDNFGGWVPADFEWSVPQTGLYDCQAKLRLFDNVGGISHGIGIGTTNDPDASFLWSSFPTSANTNRFTIYNSRSILLNAGERLRLFAYIDSSPREVAKAELIAARVR